MIVTTSPLKIPRTTRQSLSTATTLYCSSKIDIPASFMERTREPGGPHRLLLFAGLRFHGLGCGKFFDLGVGLGAQGTRMQFTSLLNCCTTINTRHGKYLFPGEILGFTYQKNRASPD